MSLRTGGGISQGRALPILNPNLCSVLTQSHGATEVKRDLSVILDNSGRAPFQLLENNREDVEVGQASPRPPRSAPHCAKTEVDNHGWTRMNADGSRGERHKKPSATPPQPKSLTTEHTDRRRQRLEPCDSKERREWQYTEFSPTNE